MDEKDTENALAGLTREQLTAKRDALTAEFNAEFGDGTVIPDDKLEALNALVAQISDVVAALASGDDTDGGDDDTDADTDATDPTAMSVPTETAAVEPTEPEAPAAPAQSLATTIAAQALRDKVASLSVVVPKRTNKEAMSSKKVAEAPKKDMRSIVFANGDDLGVTTGTGLNWAEMAEALDQRLRGYNHGLYSNAHRSKKSLSSKQSFAAIRRPETEFRIDPTMGREVIEDIIERATNEKRLEGGSLVASGGWGAPSQVLYDEFLELESTDGILDVPEIQVTRGGVQITTGTSFADIYANITGFDFDEAADIAGDYALTDSGAPTEGPKPSYHVENPSFIDYRLGVSGLSIQAGLLAARGYPEHLARILRGATVAHEHRINALVIAKIASLSTGVTMPAGQKGAVAPVLSSIELQAKHYRTRERMRRDASLEGVFPEWLLGVFRADLSRRLGLSEFAVTDAMVNAWFAERNIAVQWVYDWQSIDTTPAASFTQWPTSVTFLLYAAGTFVRGASDIISLNTLYDSTLLAQNDFSALFTEEGWFVAKKGYDSRAVTLSIEANGYTNAGGTIVNSGAAS